MMPVVEVLWLLRKCAKRDTSAGPNQWAENNPLFGHCAVAATTAHDFLGGKITSRFFPAEWAKRFGNRSHYWNVLPNGTAVDFSRDQFPPDFPLDDFMAGKLGESRGDADMREYLLSVSATDFRYNVLRDRIRVFLETQPILCDEKFQRLWELAFSGESVCKKARFACLVYNGGTLIAKDVNRPMTAQFGDGRFCALNGVSCKRENLPPRSDPSIGDCGHSIPWCLRQVFEAGYKPSDLARLDFYEQGFYPDGDPWFRPKPEYTCLACQNLFAVFGLDKVQGAYEGRWTPLWTKDSFYSCAGYALGEKKI